MNHQVMFTNTAQSFFYLGRNDIESKGGEIFPDSPSKVDRLKKHSTLVVTNRQMHAQVRYPLSELEQVKF